MSIYTGSKGRPGAQFPDNAVDSAWNRLEPLITAEKLRSQFLFGIPLVSALRDPITKKADVLTDDILKDIIVRSLELAEVETGIDIMPLKRRDKLPFDRFEYESFGYLRIPHRPISTVDSLDIVPADGNTVYKVPLEWVETAYLQWGQINIVPLTIATGTGGFVPVNTAGGAVFLSIFANMPWMPAFWQVEYTTGYLDGKLPRHINELIGTIAAMEVLGLLGATYARVTSSSLGIDSLSQSVSGPGPQLFAVRIQELADKKKELIKKIKTNAGIKIFSGNV